MLHHLKISNKHVFFFWMIINMCFVNLVALVAVFFVPTFIIPFRDICHLCRYLRSNPSHHAVIRRRLSRKQPTVVFFVSIVFVESSGWWLFLLSYLHTTIYLIIASAVSIAILVIEFGNVVDFWVGFIFQNSFE